MNATRLVSLLVVAVLQAGCDFLGGSGGSESNNVGRAIPGTVRAYSESPSEDRFHVTSEPQFSPDGQQLLVLGWDWTHGNSVFLQSVGDSARSFLTGGFSPSWSPDGEWIAFKGVEGSIWKTSRDGASRVQLYQRRVGSRVKWSRDGTKLVFLSSDPSFPGVVEILSDGTQARQLIERPCSVPNWFPDGDILCFSVPTLAGDAILIHYDYKNSSTDTVGNWISYPRELELSPDGSRVLYYNDGIWLANSDGTDARLIIGDDLQETVPGGKPKRLVGPASWHPDSRHIIFEQFEFFKYDHSGAFPNVEGEFSFRLLDITEL